VDNTIKKFLATIGEKGGRKSRRKLTKEQARTMVNVREARKAYLKYYHQCFWSYIPNLKITASDVKWVGEQIMKNGGREAWLTGIKLCR